MLPTTSTSTTRHHTQISRMEKEEEGIRGNLGAQEQDERSTLLTSQQSRLQQLSTQPPCRRKKKGVEAAALLVAQLLDPACYLGELVTSRIGRTFFSEEKAALSDLLKREATPDETLLRLELQARLVVFSKVALLPSVEGAVIAFRRSVEALQVLGKIPTPILVKEEFLRPGTRECTETAAAINRLENHLTTKSRLQATWADTAVRQLPSCVTDYVGPLLPTPVPSFQELCERSFFHEAFDEVPEFTERQTFPVKGNPLPSSSRLLDVLKNPTHYLGNAIISCLCRQISPNDETLLLDELKRLPFLEANDEMDYGVRLALFAKAAILPLVEGRIAHLTLSIASLQGLRLGNTQTTKHLDNTLRQTLLYKQEIVVALANLEQDLLSRKTRYDNSLWSTLTQIVLYVGKNLRIPAATPSLNESYANLLNPPTDVNTTSVFTLLETE